MIKKFNYQNITWIDLTTPTKEEVQGVSSEYAIHPVAAGELSEPSLRAKVDIYDNFIYLILHLPNHGSSHESNEDRPDTIEIDFIIGKDFLITTSYDLLEPMQEFGKILETSNLLMKNQKDTHAGFLFYYIIKHLYQSLEGNLEGINYSLKKAETKIFSGNEKEMVMVLAEINKKLLDFRSTLKTHKEVLNSLEVVGEDFFGKKFHYHLQAMMGEYNKVWYALENCREFFNELRQTNESLLQIKTNESTKIFTMLAFITFPLTLLVTLLSLRSPGTPIVDLEYGFWYISGLLLAFILLILAYYKHKKWM